MNARTILAFGVLLPFLAGCGEEVDTGLKSRSFAMGLALGVRTEVRPGDVIEPAGEGTVITVSHDIVNSVKYVTLVSGSATLAESEEE